MALRGKLQRLRKQRNVPQEELAEGQQQLSASYFVR
jgi:transcriptional regulator with XRE-family HTH domain